MKKWEKEILAKQTGNEAMTVVNLEKVYKKSLDEINDKIQVLMAKDQSQLSVEIPKRIKKTNRICIQ